VLVALRKSGQLTNIASLLIEYITIKIIKTNNRIVIVKLEVAY
jgi:hypothetical protein